MTPPTITTPLSAGTFLFGDDTVTELANRLTGSGVLQEAHHQLAAVGDSVWASAGKELASMAGEFLDLDLASVALAGWCRHRELLDIARRLDGTTASAVVPLWTHDISLTQEPRIDLDLGAITVAVITFEVKIDIKVIGVAGVVRGATLVALEGGHCEVTASFSAAGICLATRTADIDPHRAIPLGKGIPLIPDPRSGAGRDGH
jgi:hypothetical protein